MKTDVQLYKEEVRSLVLFLVGMLVIMGAFVFGIVQVLSEGNEKLVVSMVGLLVLWGVFLIVLGFLILRRYYVSKIEAWRGKYCTPEKVFEALSLENLPESERLNLLLIRRVISETNSLDWTDLEISSVATSAPDEKVFLRRWIQMSGSEKPLLVPTESGQTIVLWVLEEVVYPYWREVESGERSRNLESLEYEEPQVGYLLHPGDEGHGV